MELTDVHAATGMSVLFVCLFYLTFITSFPSLKYTVLLLRALTDKVQCFKILYLSDGKNAEDLHGRGLKEC